MPTRTERQGYRRLLERFQADPAIFAQEVLGVHLWSAQRDVLASIPHNRRVAVRSGNGVGKTFLAAVSVLWFLYCFPRSRVITTATTWPQVERQLWHEIGLLHAQAPAEMGGRCLQTELQLPDGRYAVGLSTAPHHLESFQGHHAPSLLLIFDEASGIPRPIYDAGEGYMTTAGARWLLIGNPTRPDGEFYAAFHSRRGEYVTHHISVLDSPNLSGEEVPDGLAVHLPSREWVAEREKWRGTPMWDVRVLGDFPSQASDAINSLARIEGAQGRSLEIHPLGDRVVAVDVARFGSDETVIATLEDRRVRITQSYVGKATTETVGYAANEARRINAARVVVDDVGVGGGVTDQLREQGFDVVAFNGGASPVTDGYPNARSELWFEASEQLLESDLDGDEQLAADLVAPVYKLDSRGRRVVEAKDETRKRLGRSPDRADAALMLFAPAQGIRTEIW